MSGSVVKFDVPIYERQALVNKQSAMANARQSNENNKSEQISVNLPKTVPVNTFEKISRDRRCIRKNVSLHKIVVDLIDHHKM